MNAPPSPSALPDLAAIVAARSRIAPYVRRTPVLHCESLDQAVGAKVFWKCECFQRVGAFKARGAVNAVFSLGEAEAARGVVTHSSGNHGAALAYAASCRGIASWVVMPRNAPRVKQENVLAFGAQVRLCEPTAAARAAECDAVRRETGATLVHPFDDERVIAGQGTAVLELLEDVPDLDAVVVPVGGGGLLSGTAIAARATRPAIRVFGAEPALADDAARGFASGVVEPVSPTTTATIADGLRTPLSPRTLAAIRAHVAGIGIASEAAIVAAMRLVFERLKITIEPSSAVPLACLREGTIAARGLRIGIVVSGGNVDLDHLPWMAPHGH
jgi:threonine dehydratase